MITALQQSKILIVDDEAANVLLLQRHLERAGYRNLLTTTDSAQALPLFLEHHPDLVVLDLMMPCLDGFGVMEQFRPYIEHNIYLPILVLTADMTSEAKERSLKMGARDFLLKPFDATELLLRIHNLLETRYLYRAQQDLNDVLEARVRERTRELDHSQVEILERLARAAEFRDDDTGQHTYRVANLCALIAREIGQTDEQIDLICRAAPLHDVGKIGISDLILLKPARLTPQEFEIVKTHAEIGAALLDGGASELVQLAEEIARTHHERWDGKGYPHGLTGSEIPLSGRIVAIADVFDALTNERPYKSAWPIEKAVEEIKNHSGTHFDPELIEAFERVCRRGFEIQNRKAELRAS